ncbi:MAG TPA: NADPH-dependent FMN reductase [Candidatus Binatia bacterium]|nr:NADPH-dependent FMN reductase [Candidatus Binatia bacterium]
MTRIVVLPGSWRAGSVNLALARAAVAAAPAGCEAVLHSIREVPLYDGDLETASGIPAPVRALKDAVAAADGLLLVTPEYNNSVPGTLKNAIDWMSRPPADSARVFAGRPVGLIGATPGAGGTRLAQGAWLPVLKTLGTQLWTGGSLFVAGASKVFDASGRLTDEKVRELLEKYMKGFAEFVAAARRGG